ncbi:MAG: BadF/BadG/BcrA/BcrD ATPase family protein [Bacteroidota bacterium]
MPTPPLLFVGIDAGGTKTTVYAATADGQTHIESRGGPANLRVQGVTSAYATITALVDEVQDTLDLPLGGLCVGAAGAGDASLRAQLHQQLQYWSDVPLTVTTDADIALHAALGTAPGYLIIAGTGSIVYGRAADGAIHRAGGWGRVLGDDGSGTALGRAVLRAVAAAFDGGPATMLTALVQRRHPAHQLADVLNIAFSTPSLAVFAPLAFEAAEARDAVAVALISDAAAQLAMHVLRLAHAQPAIPRRVFLTGGVMQQPPFRHALHDALTAAVSGWRLTLAATAPHRGAWAIAAASAASPPA